MKGASFSLTSGLLLSMSLTVTATTLYVDVNNPGPAAPYTNWVTAATNIQDAVDAAVAGDQILVTNGVYQAGGRDVYAMTNRVAITKAVVLQSVNGPRVTVIRGSGPKGPAAVRCVYLTNGAVLAGFTLTNGWTHLAGDDFKERGGGGVWCETGGSLTNCVITGNTASSYGGGALGGTLDRCTLSNNWGGQYGGGASFSTLNKCILTGNGTVTEGGGAFQCALGNCILSGNSSMESGAGMGQCVANNCSLAGNSDGAILSTLNNCIVYYNTRRNYFDCTLNSCCTTPDRKSVV